MKILFYTARPLAVVNAYNTTELMRCMPEHEYASVTVVKKPKKRSPLGRVRRAVPFKLGRYRIERDRERLQAEIARRTHYDFLDKMPNTDVGAVNDEASVRAIEAFGPDIIVQSGAGILKPNTFGQAKIATINVHHGYAPEIRGMQSTNWALYYGLHDSLGVTAHVIDEHIDTGAVILQYKHDYRQGETFFDIQKRLVIEGAHLLVEAVRRLPQPHDFEVDDVKSYYFSAFSKDKYDALAKRGFRPVESPTGLKTKVKPKKIMRFTDA